MNCCNTEHAVAAELSTFVNPQLAYLAANPVGRELLHFNCCCQFFPQKHFYTSYTNELEWNLIQQNYNCCKQSINNFSNIGSIY